MLMRLAFDRPVDDDTYVELVRSLAATLVNTALFGGLFGIVAVWAMANTSDLVLTVAGFLGLVVALARVAAVLALRRRVAGPRPTRDEACRAERRFGPVYLAFAAIVGLFAGRACQTGPIELQLLATTLIVGFAAGVAAGLSLRPWISVPSIVLAVVPTIAASLLRGGSHQILLAFVLTALLAGGAGSMLSRYRSETEKISLRQLLGTLARQDHLTGLANRLALTDTYVRHLPLNGGETVAVHCLDLDGFKQVNDRYGHPAGDILLQQVADRLRSIVRKSDVAARLGGDEFVVLQTGVTHPSEAELMARRVVRILREPYMVEDHQVSVGVSVGFAVASFVGEDLAHLLESADQALYQVKRQGGGAAHGALEEQGAGNVVRLAG
jgi:diguanylate cyclase (GGDEF)-like protein